MTNTIANIKEWFKSNFTASDEESKNSIVTNNGNLFRLEILTTREIKEMVIPVNQFEEFKILKEKQDFLDSQISAIDYSISEKCTWQHEIDEALKTNEVYQKLNAEYDEIDKQIQTLQTA